ncbi:hypothetical protein JHK86_018926 [Glycine max]|nr:hypothetical protein JHK86_018926 [Glycine max]
MADALSVIPAAVLRNLADKLYEKRKNAALEVEGIVKQLAGAGDHDRITAVINLLTTEYTFSPQANHRKGGLISLAAATVGLTTEAAQHLEQIVPPVLDSFADQDSRVRYYACEALYNIAKVVRGDFIIFFNQIFDALCKLSADSDANVQSAAHLLDQLVKNIVTESDQFRDLRLICNASCLLHFTLLIVSIEEFIPLLRDRMNVLNPYVHQFLVGWITVLDSVPDIDMLGFLPDFLDGLFNMLSDSSHEIRQQADSALSEFLQEIKNSPVRVNLFADSFLFVHFVFINCDVQCASFSPNILKEKQHVLFICHFLTRAVLLLKSVDYGRMAEILVQRAGSPDEFTRLTAITWINEFVKLGGYQLVPYYADILRAILPCISNKEEKIRVVARETNEELRAIQADPAEAFDVGAILSIARRNKGSTVLTFLNDIFDTLLKALSDSSVEVVLLVLDVHACIARDPHLFRQLVVFLVHNFQLDNFLLEKHGALIVRRLCVLLNAERVYRELSTILEGETDLDFASIMVQALNLILLTSSELSEIRDLLKQSLVNPAGKDLYVSLYASWCHSPMAIISLCFLAQLLEPGRYIWLFKALYGLLMLLPQQSAAFKILKTRLKAVPSYSFNGEQLKRMPSGDSYQFHNVPDGFRTIQDGDIAEDGGSSRNGINFAARLQQFRQIQHQHRLLSKTGKIVQFFHFIVKGC